MRKSLRGVALLSCIVAGALALAGCAGGGSTSSSSSSSKAPASVQDLTFQLNFTPGGFNAGFEYAAVHNLYKDAGLNVTISPGTGSAVTAQLVASGQATIGYADSTATGPLIAKGAPMKTIMTIYQSNPNQVTVLSSSKVNGVKDLKGLRVGVPTAGSQTSMLPVLLAKNGLKDSDITAVNLPGTSLVQSLLQGQVDAILGSTDSYGVQLAQQGAKTKNWLFADSGVATVSTSVFANTTFLVEHPDIAKAFVKASLEGWKAVFADQQAGVDAVSKYFPTTKPEQTALEIKAVLPLVCANGAKYVGKATTAAWKNTQDILGSVNLLPAGTDPTKYYTYNYLPKDSELQPCVNDKPQGAQGASASPSSTK